MIESLTRYLSCVWMRMQDANMNVVRNWGGGIYQHEDFCMPFTCFTRVGCPLHAKLLIGACGLRFAALRR